MPSSWPVPDYPVTVFADPDNRQRVSVGAGEVFVDGKHVEAGSYVVVEDTILEGNPALFESPGFESPGFESPLLEGSDDLPRLFSAFCMCSEPFFMFWSALVSFFPSLGSWASSFLTLSASCRVASLISP